MNIVYSHRTVARLFFLFVFVFFSLNGLNTGSFSIPTARAAPPLCTPTITFTSVPTFGIQNEKVLSGSVSCVAPASFKVAVYIYVSGWWTKPTFANPLTNIGSNGNWSTTIVTGGVDELATQIAAFLLPVGINPPPMGGAQPLPQELFDSSVAYRIIDRYRTIEFSGIKWNVKSSEAKVGPGPNYFSAGENDVWVDDSGQLHLTITSRNGKWYCTEVFTQAPLGYGIYTFELGSPVEQLDKNAVLGLFTWDDNAPQQNYREIDIELSRWGNSSGDDAQYVVQPYSKVGNIHRFTMPSGVVNSTHSFEWNSDHVSFSSYQGYPPSLGPLIDSWTYTGPDIPPEGAGNARINLWLNNGTPPSNGQNMEVVIKAFDHVPFPIPNADTTGVFRPSDGLLYLKNTNEPGFADIALNFGLPGDYPVVGDWDGNGTVTIGVYRQGYFYLKNSNTLGFADVVFAFGQTGDQPIAGDWDRNGIDTIGVYRPSNGQFLLRNSNDEGLAEASFFLGNVGDVGVAGDWNGDGFDTTGVFRPSNGVIFLKNSNKDGFADIALNYGLPGDQPVMGDWNHDGIDTIGVYRNGLFYLRNSNTNGFADIIFALGNPGDMPIAGDWDRLP